MTWKRIAVIAIFAVGAIATVIFGHVEEGRQWLAVAAGLAGVAGLATAGGKSAKALLPLAGVLLLATGCASGQQGQGETRVANVQGVYAEHVTLNVPPEATATVRFMERFGGESGDQDVTLQPTAEGTAEATNQPDVAPEIPINLSPGSGSGN